jgi:hypothetical protein
MPAEEAMTDTTDECDVCRAMRATEDLASGPAVVVRLTGDYLTDPVLEGEREHLLPGNCTAEDFLSLLEFIYPALRCYPAGALSLLVGSRPATRDYILRDGDQVCLISSRVPVVQRY